MANAVTGRLVAVLIAVAFIGGCGVESGDERGDGSVTGSTGNESGAGRVDRLHALAHDQPGGPSYSAALLSSPSESQLSTAAQGDGSRGSGERFAILMTHAITDTTSPDSGFESFLVDGFSSAAMRGIDENRKFSGIRVVPGSRSWLRSSFEGNGDGVVYLLVNFEIPKIGFSAWDEVRVEVTRDGSGWVVSDYRAVGAAETAKPSKPIWETTFDSGRGWRRVPVG